MTKVRLIKRKDVVKEPRGRKAKSPNNRVRIEDKLKELNDMLRARRMNPREKFHALFGEPQPEQ
ncbi:MAG TPA: hypothetical protein VG778_07080 [Blastocatellia bacterium]|jgi:hypothetical protein|nr:hypothetical protein [Blastocatellia bacterium]